LIFSILCPRLGAECIVRISWVPMQGAFGTDFYDRSTRTISRHYALDGV